MIGRRQHRFQAFVTALTLVLGVAGPAAAQGLLQEGIRIGVIVPEVPAGGAGELAAAVARSAEQGAILAEEEYQIHAEMMKVELSVLTATATGADVIAAAERLVGDEGVFGMIGGYDAEEAAVLGAWAEERGIPFLNVAASADSLRQELCFDTTFHVEPSAAMYLDALAGWYVRAGFRRWYFVQQDSDEGRAQYERMIWSIEERHFGAREAGRTMIAAGESIGDDVARAIRRSDADLVLLLLGASDQLRVLSELEAAGIEVTVAGFPYQEAQTRTFFAASRDAAPNLGTDHRAAAWEATLDAYGAREYNARHLLRWDEPMNPSAWATYHAVRILFEAAFYGGSVASADVLAYLSGENSVFDLHKGIGSTFRPWDRQLRQSLYLVKIDETATDAFDLALLVGELPAIYKPGTDPIERLDQLGDLEDQSRCSQQ